MKCIALISDLEATPRAVAFFREALAEAGCSVKSIEIKRVKEGEGSPGLVEALALDSAEKALQLLDRGNLDAIAAIGGAVVTGVASRVMAALPIGLPKLIVSSMAGTPSYSGEYFAAKDITIMNSLVGLMGMNPILENVLERAARSLAAAAAVERPPGVPGALGAKRRVAVTGFQFTSDATRYAISLLEEAGLEVHPFHAQGVGEISMEALIGEGFFDGVLDLVPAGVSERLLGGNRRGEYTRLEAAGDVGVAQVIAPGGFDMISCGPLTRGDGGDRLWRERGLMKRKLYIPDNLRVEARTNAVELREVAEVVAGKLNKAKGPTAVIIPRKGWSSLSVEGGPLEDFEADRAFSERLLERLCEEVSYDLLPAPINSPEFIAKAVKTLLTLMGEASRV
ncbi:MAG: hypothetical protein C0608_01645 [Deltaproteobacteria bacterium]|nr:MAG: hypothetical protein C0608_01645 [Deltaproteobacteria bacterium]